MANLTANLVDPQFSGLRPLSLHWSPQIQGIYLPYQFSAFTSAIIVTKGLVPVLGACSCPAHGLAPAASTDLARGSMQGLLLRHILGANISLGTMRNFSDQSTLPSPPPNCSVSGTTVFLSTGGS
ncbi:hypothetical protein J3A83DRAFT_4185801 [Scleroderma citrinum]